MICSRVICWSFYRNASLFFEGWIRVRGFDQKKFLSGNCSNFSVFLVFIHLSFYKNLIIWWGKQRDLFYFIATLLQLDGWWMLLFCWCKNDFKTRKFKPCSSPLIDEPLETAFHYVLSTFLKVYDGRKNKQASERCDRFKWIAFTTPFEG